MSRVSVRTVHFHDEVGLLKPAYHGASSDSCELASRAGAGRRREIRVLLFRAHGLRWRIALAVQGLLPTI